MATAVLEAPKQLDPSERPKMVPGAEDGEFQRFDTVCVFDEHTGDDGVVYDRQLLEAIAENNNRRIRDTGDFVPIVVQHTGDEESPPEYDPPVIGLAGPFFLDKLGAENPRWGIFTTFWIFQDCVAQFRRCPRRSVEIWPEDRPEDRYFDPIAVLGAETPKRDLGLIYSMGRAKNGKRPVRYEASMPSGSNTFIPSTGNDKSRRKNQTYQQGVGDMPDNFTPQQLDQLREVIASVAQPMIDEAMMGAGGGEELTPAPDLGPETPPPMDDETTNYMAGMYRKFRKYQMDDGSFNEEGASAFLDTLDPEESQQFSQYMKYKCDDAGMKQNYSKMAGSDISDDDQPKVVDQYRKKSLQAAHEVRKYRNEAIQYKRQAEQYKQELEEYRKKERYARRRAVFVEMVNEGYSTIDPDAEVTLTENYSDGQFDAHVENARQQYQKAPLDRLELGQGQPEPHPSRARTIKERKRDELSRRAKENCQQLSKEGKPFDYKKELDRLIAEEERNAA